MCARVAVVLGVVIALAAACGSGRGNVAIDRMDVKLTVLPDGSVQAEERFVVRFSDVSTSTFRRFVPALRHDGVSDIEATMDGKVFPVGDGAGHVVVGRDDDLDVRWSFASSAGGAHIFGLKYRAAHAVSISGLRGTLSWLVLPAGHPFAVGVSTVTVELPPATVQLQDPWVDEAGWTVQRHATAVSASRNHVAPAESATIGAEFSVDHLSVARPQWQADEALASEFVPAFVSAGISLVVVGIGVLIMLRLKYPPWKTPEPGDDTTADVALVDADGVGAVAAERLGAARDLRRAGIAVVLLGVAICVFIAIALPQFGVWPWFVSGGVLAVGLMFIVAAARFAAATEAGVRARMLYFARVRDGRTPS